MLVRLIRAVLGVTRCEKDINYVRRNYNVNQLGRRLLDRDPAGCSGYSSLCAWPAHGQESLSFVAVVGKTEIILLITANFSMKVFFTFFISTLLFGCNPVFAQNHTVVVVFHNCGSVTYPGSSMDFTMTVQGYWVGCACWWSSSGLVVIPAVAPYHSVRVYLPVSTSIAYTNVAWVKFSMVGAADTGQMPVRLAGGNDSPIICQAAVDFTWSPRSVSGHAQRLVLLKTRGHPVRIISK